MKMKCFLIILILFISGCESSNNANANDAILNFSEEKSSKNLAEIYRFSDGTKVYSEFANIKFTIDGETINLYDGLEQNMITIDDIINKMTYKTSLNDGGTKIYRFEIGDNDLSNINFILVQCHKVNFDGNEKYNKDIIIGSNQEIVKKCDY